MEGRTHGLNQADRAQWGSRAIAEKFGLQKKLNWRNCKLAKSHAQQISNEVLELADDFRLRSQAVVFSGPGRIAL